MQIASDIVVTTIEALASPIFAAHFTTTILISTQKSI